MCDQPHETLPREHTSLLLMCHFRFRFLIRPAEQILDVYVCVTGRIRNEFMACPMRSEPIPFAPRTEWGWATSLSVLFMNSVFISQVPDCQRRRRRRVAGKTKLKIHPTLNIRNERTEAIFCTSQFCTVFGNVQDHLEISHGVNYATAIPKDVNQHTTRTLTMGNVAQISASSALRSIINTFSRMCPFLCFLFSIQRQVP